MRKTTFAISFFLVSVSLSPFTQNVSADGMVISAHYQPVYLPSQKAAIFWNGHPPSYLMGI